MSFKPWEFAPRGSLRDRDLRDFRETAGARRDEERKAPAKELPFDRLARDERQQQGPKKKGNLLDRAMGGLESVGRGGLKALDVLGEYAGRPAFAVATGMTESNRRLDPATGQYTRSKPGWGDVLPAIGEALTSDPRETYQQARQAYEETVRRPGFSVFGLPETASRALTEGVTDPFMYTPAGTAARLGIRGGGVGSVVARNLIEGPGRVAPAIIGGGAAGAELGKRSGLPGGETIGQLGGALLGGGTMAAANRRRTPVMSSAVDATSPGGDEVMNTLGKHQIPFRVVEDGSIVVDDVDYAREVLKKLEAEYVHGGVEHTGMRDFFGKRKPVNERMVQGYYPQQDEIIAIKRAIDPDELYNPKPDVRDETLDMPVTPGHIVVEDGETWMKTSTTFKRPSKEAIKGAQEAADRINEVFSREGITPREARAELMADLRGSSYYSWSSMSAGDRAYYARVMDFVGEDPRGDFFENYMRLDTEARARQTAATPEPPPAAAEAESPFVKRPDLFGNVHDTFQTEAELNGWRAPGATEATAAGRQRQFGGMPEPEAPAPPPPPRPEQPLPGQTSMDMGEAQVPARAIAVGDTVTDVQGRQWTVTDTADPATLGVRSPQGAQTRLGRNAIAGGAEPGPRTEAPRAAPEPEPEAPRAEQAAPGPEPQGPPPPLDRTSDYSTLGLDPSKTYTKDELKAAYRAQARRYHPDINGAATAEADMKAINNAFDRMMRGQARTGFAQGARRTAKEQRAYEEARRQAAEDAKRWRQQTEEEIRQAQERAHAEAQRTRSAQMGGMPPKEPPKEPPIRGRGQNQPFGSEEKPLFDALDAPTVKRARAQFEGNLSNKVDAKLRSMLGRLRGEQVRKTVDPVIDAKRRIDARVTHFVESRVDLIRAEMRSVGLATRKVGDEIHLFADGKDIGFAEDIAERVSAEGRAAFDALTPEQQAVFGPGGALAETNRMKRETLQVHGASLPMDEAIEGEYWGRVATGRQYETITGEARMREAQGSPTSRSVGANRIKSRTMESVEAGIKQGIKYDDPWDGFAVRLRGALLTAEDAWLKKSLDPLAVRRPESTLGLGAVYGHPAFNNLFFETDVAQRIQRGLDTAQGGVLRQYASAVNNVMTPLRASFDLSATLQQGMRMWLTNPKAAASYWWTVMKSVKDDAVYDGAILKLNTDGPGLDYLTSHGLRYTGDASQGEFIMPRAVLERAKGAGKVGQGVNAAFLASNKVFSRTLNLYRVHFANSQHARLVAAGLEGADLDEAMRRSTAGINRMFGWTETGPTSLEQAAVFAPRYTRAAVETIVKAVSDGGIEGKLARTHMGLLLAEGAATVFLLNAMRGYETEFDPRDPNFLRLRNVGGLDVSPFGTYNTLFRAIAQTAAGSDFATYGKNRPDPGALWKFAEGKLSPAMKLLYEPLKGETYLGEPQDILGDPLGVIREQALSSLPFGAQAAIKEGPVAATVQSFGLSSTPLSPTERRDFRRDEVAREMFGKEYAELSGADKSRVNENEDVAKHQADADRNTLTRTGDRSRMTAARLDHSRKVDELSASFQRGEISGNDWREQYQTLQAELRGARDVLKSGGGSDKDVDGWFDLFDRAELPDGRIEWDQLEGLQAEYASRHPDIETKIDRITGTQDNEVLRQYREARQLAKEYYTLPAYRGMSVEDSQEASGILAAANSMVAYGYARDRDDALRKLRQTEPEGVRKAMMALRRGVNTERQKWRKDPANRLFGVFYSDFTQSQVA